MYVHIRMPTNRHTRVIKKIHKNQQQFRNKQMFLVTYEKNDKQRIVKTITTKNTY